MSGYHNNSIFWVETSKIYPNPLQPRREFDPRALEDLADSIRQYGVLQPLVVTRKETVRPDDQGMDVHYELIAGERRLRASKIAGLQQVPVIIRKETDNKVKLELAIIENLQREDLNPIDRALAFEQLHKDFGLTHVEIGKRMGKSRVFVSNSLRLLALPDEIKQGLIDGRITEGHTRPLLMLADRPEEQMTLYKEIMVKKMSVRDAEKVARKIAQDRVRKKEFVVDPKIRDYEQKLSENLGTRVHIEPKEQGGKITIDYFTLDDLELILGSMKKNVQPVSSMMDQFLGSQEESAVHDTPSLESRDSKSVEDLNSTTALDFSEWYKAKPLQEESTDSDHSLQTDMTSIPVGGTDSRFDSIPMKSDHSQDIGMSENMIFPAHEMSHAIQDNDIQIPEPLKQIADVSDEVPQDNEAPYKPLASSFENDETVDQKEQALGSQMIANVEPQSIPTQTQSEYVPQAPLVHEPPQQQESFKLHQDEFLKANAPVARDMEGMNTVSPEPINQNPVIQSQSNMPMETSSESIARPSSPLEQEISAIPGVKPVMHNEPMNSSMPVRTQSMPVAPVDYSRGLDPYLEPIGDEDTEMISDDNSRFM